MSGIKIYMEGGGKGKAAGKRIGTKKALQIGMDEFLSELKNAATAKKWNWDIICCGGREDTYKNFVNAWNYAEPGEIVVLLVDAEAPVNAKTSVEHLRTQRDSDGKLTGVPPEQVHLMVQTMETWIVADREALESHFGVKFGKNAFPKAVDLETVSKTEVLSSLVRAVRRATNRDYDKIWDAAEILKLIDANKVRSRCRHCKNLFNYLGTAIKAG